MSLLLIRDGALVEDVRESGSQVKIKNTDIVATVDSLAVHRGDRVQYEVVWYSNGVRYTAWLHPGELITKEDT